MSEETKPEEFPEQSQNQPGIQAEMNPQPEVVRPGYRGSDKLANRKALITGGDSGIGRSVAVHFAKEGADCAIIYLKEEEEDAQRTKELVEQEGRQCALFSGDLCEGNFVESLAERTRDSLGGLDILVNNAAQQFPEDAITEISSDHLRKTFEINILSMFTLTQTVLKEFPDGGVIVNSTSVTGYRGSEHLIDYASTKGAITAFTRSLAKNLASRGIRVNAVAPGPIWTPLIPATFDDISDFGTDTPLGRAGQPSEVAPAYVYLASPDSSYVTGQVIHVNGGEVVGG